MKSINRTLLITTAAVIAAAVCFALRKPGKTATATTLTAAQWQQARLKLYNDSIYPAMLLLVKPGYLVTRLGSDITSEMIRQMNQTDQSFSHCGIAAIEKDTVFVYHAIGGEFNPDQKLKRETLYSFGYPSDNKATGLFTAGISNGQLKKLQGIVSGFYLKGTRFDMDFNYESEDRLYCAEFVAKSYSRAIGDSSWFKFSHAEKFRYVSVDNLVLSDRVTEIKRWHY